MYPIPLEHPSDMALRAATLVLVRAGWTVVEAVDVDPTGVYYVTLRPPRHRSAEERREALGEAEAILLDPLPVRFSEGPDPGDAFVGDAH